MMTGTTNNPLNLLDLPDDILGIIFEKRREIMRKEKLRKVKEDIAVALDISKNEIENDFIIIMIQTLVSARYNKTIFNKIGGFIFI